MARGKAPTSPPGVRPGVPCASARFPRLRFRAKSGASLLAAVTALMLAGPAQSAPLAPGNVLPPLRGELLSGGKIVLPDSALGSESLLLLGFTYESRHEVEAWVVRIRRDFGAESSLRWYEVPMLGGAARLARPFIDGGMRRGTPRELHDRVLTVYRDAKEWKRHAGFTTPDVAYVLLVSREGRLVWRGQGPLDDRTYDALAGEVRALRAANAAR